MKRTLALVLALVMVFGLMAFPASADFTDDAEIKYVEAVDVMSAIGVIDGFEDGSFDPDGLLTREQAAKVVAYLRLNASDADKLATTGAPFDDVAADRWSAGYISYCVSEGIINGRDENTFDPTGNITGYEFAKLMLGALGYDSEIEGYTGSSWAIEVSKDALTVGLFDGNKGADYNQPITREEAALYAFNMLQADLVDYEDRGTVIDLGGGVSIVTGASKAEAIIGSGYDTIDDSDNHIQYAERYFEDLEKNAGEDDAFGRPSTEWVYDGDDVGTYSDEADFTYTEKTEGKEIYSDLDKPDDDTVYGYYVDGARVTITDIYDGFAIASGNDEEIGGNGTLVEVYELDKDEDGNEVYRVVVINTYVAEITDWNEADEDDDEEESIDISTYTDPSDLNSYLTNFNDNFETTKFDQDDADDNTIVYYTAAWDSGDEEFVIKSVDAAELVTATPTRSSTSSFVAGGETYKYSANHEGTIGKSDVDADEDIDFYLDSYGYVIYVDADGSSSDDYAFVIGIEETSDSFSSGDYVAKLLLASGEIVVVDLDEEDCKPAVTNENYDDFDKTIVTYSSNRDDEYQIDLCDNELAESGSNYETVGAELEITKGRSRIEVDGSSYTTTSKTVFFTYKDGINESKIDDDDFDAYVGISNAPSVDGRSGSQAIVVMDGSRVAAVFVADARTTSSGSNDLMAVAYDASEAWNSKGEQKDPEYDADYGEYYEFEVVTADGSIETMMFSADLITASTGFDSRKTDAIFGLASYSLDDEGVVTDFDIATNDDDCYTAEGTTRVEDDVVGLGDDSFTYSDDCAVFRMDKNATWRSSSVSSIRTDSNDEVAYVLGDNDIVVAIFILEIDGGR